MSGEMFCDHDYMKVLRTLAEGPARREELIDRVGEEFSSSATSRLKSQGYVEDVKIPTEPNRVVWTLSEEGEAVIQRWAEIWQEAEESLETDDV